MPLLDVAAQIGNGPGEIVLCGGCRSEERAQGVAPQLVSEIGNLLVYQLGAVAATRLIHQGSKLGVAIGTTPLRQARMDAASNLDALGGRRAQAVESYRLKPSAIASE